MSLPAHPWHTSGGDNTRRGLFDSDVRIAPSPTRRLTARGAVQASMVFDNNNRAFVADMAGWVQAFNADGQLLWHQQLQGGVSASPAVDRGTDRLFLGTHLGWVYALQNSTGAIQWKKEIPTKNDPRILSDLLALPEHKLVVLSSWGGRFHALDSADGTTKFSWDAGISPYASASADRAETIYCLRAVPEEGLQFVRVSPEGQETILHRQPGEGRPANRQLVAAAAVLDETRRVIYFVANTDRESVLVAWSGQEDKALWTRPFSGSVQGTPAVADDGAIVVADLAGVAHAVAPDGSDRYRYPSGCEYLLTGAVCARNGQVFLGDPLGRIHVISRDGRGQTIFETPRAIQSRPSFDRSGNLHVPCTDRQVYVFPNLGG
jgi:outer membrane protein assembly factor BamB